MFRKTGIGLAALAMLAPGLAAALGVGDYKLNSYLNQPLSMEVELFDVGDLTPEEVLANLGSESDFQSSGVERVFFLNELQFEVTLQQDGNGVLSIRSTQPVREPFLNFIVEVMWPTGRLLREYTVLLDPPAFAEPVQRPAVAPVSSAQPAKVEAPASQQAPSQPRVVAQSQDYGVSRAPDYVVQPSDTLWRIALNNRPVNSISVQQMLIAIQSLNPDAFIDGNVNLVREGTVLRMPSEQEVRQISTRSAIAEVAEQNREWRAKLEARGITLPSRTQLDGTASGGGGADLGVATEGQVKLVSPDAQSGAGTGRGTGGSSSTDSSALQNELAIRDENVDRLNRQNNELSSRLQDLQEQVATSESLLKLRNSQIAQLQQQLRELQEAQGITPTEPVVIEPVTDAPVAPVTGTQAPQAAGTEAPQAAGSEAATAPAAAGGAAAAGSSGEALDPISRAAQAVKSLEGAMGADGARPATPEEIAEARKAAGMDSGAAATPEQLAADRAAAGMQQPQAQAQAGAAGTTPAPEPAAESGIVGTIMDNLVLILAGLVGLAVVIGGMAWMRRRQADKDDDSYKEPRALADADEEDDFFVDNGDFVEDLEDPSAEAGEPAQDPLEEVDVYTAYGRHAEAVTFLKNEIQKAPQRDDLKVRLLEVQAEMGDRDGFEREAAAFAGAGASVAAAISSLRAGFAGGAEEPSLDDLEMDLASDFEAPSAAPATADDTLEFDIGGDDDGDDLGSLDFDLGDSKPAEAPLIAADNDELSFDLSSDGEAELSLEDDGLSLDLDDDKTETLTLEDEGLSLDMGEEGDDELSLELDAGEEELSLDLDDAPAKAAVALDDISADLSEEADFGELSLADMSDEFSEAAEKPAAEELDLSLDELSLDDLSLDDDEPTQVSMPAVDAEPSATVQRDAVSFDDDLEEPAPLTAEQPTTARPALEPALEQALGADDDDFDFLGDTDENATKLDLAKAYIDMGDAEGARDILQEVVSEGSAEQQQEARDLLAQVG
ncbi:FimV/HubP family polar landmark protein [Alcanivorax sp. 1008]|uniref:FimV/HubP family polar landmark protein n=1 Tax=Alcanivorax sp. 1008 TaxID=2816853 RepID=UPI001DB729CE|nr:FimV/HubP family polar landmark protein [Alcanivorax sp. 1008]MCC1497655.1 peptigoglycan-binding protein LysM [Alcanivorax sp. 1008]